MYLYAGGFPKPISYAKHFPCICLDFTVLTAMTLTALQRDDRTCVSSQPLGWLLAGKWFSLELLLSKVKEEGAWLRLAGDLLASGFVCSPRGGLCSLRSGPDTAPPSP